MNEIYKFIMQSNASFIFVHSLDFFWTSRDIWSDVEFPYKITFGHHSRPLDDVQNLKRKKCVFLLFLFFWGTRYVDDKTWKKQKILWGHKIP